ncbi:MAG: hypothetical protein PHW69_08155 [Elusimicrobiaceae bacterium]|nr:hypothetical protein [Elusimicrobiaceae bacterium]
MKKIALVCCVAGAVLLAGCANMKVGSGWSGEKVKGEGFAKYTPEDPAGMRAAALVSAQRNAVEKVVGVFVSAKTLVRESITIDQKILARTQGFIKTYKVLDEGRQGDLYRVQIKAVVLVSDVNNVIGELQLDRPVYDKKVLFIAAEPGAEYASDLRTGVFGAFEKNGFAMLEDAAFASSGAGDTAAVLVRARAAGADFALRAEAAAYPLEGVPGLGGSFVSMRAKITLKLLEVSSGRTVAEESREASAIDPVRQIAQRKAVSAAAGLAAGIVEMAARRAASGGVVITLSVEGLDGIEQVARIKTALDSTLGVESYNLRRYVHGEARFDVNVSSITGEELASSILRQLPFKMLSVTQYAVELAVED